MTVRTCLFCFADVIGEDDGFAAVCRACRDDPNSRPEVADPPVYYHPASPLPLSQRICAGHPIDEYPEQGQDAYTWVVTYCGRDARLDSIVVTTRPSLVTCPDCDGNDLDADGPNTSAIFFHMLMLDAGFVRRAPQPQPEIRL